MATVRTVVGIDLAGSPKRNTGICRMRGKKVLAYATAFADDEVMAFVRDSKPDLIVIDAPLHLPPGRKTRSICARACPMVCRQLSA